DFVICPVNDGVAWPALVLKGDGRLGIRNTSPIAPLHVNTANLAYATDLLSSRDNATAIFKTHGTDSGILSIGAGGPAGAVYLQRSNGAATGTFPLLLQPYGGNVGIGTGNNTIDAKLIVADPTNYVQMRI